MFDGCECLFDNQSIMDELAPLDEVSMTMSLPPEDDDNETRYVKMQQLEQTMMEHEWERAAAEAELVAMTRMFHEQQIEPTLVVDLYGT